MLSRLVITFLPRIKCLLISWLQLPSAVILEPQNIKCHLFPIYLGLWGALKGPHSALGPMGAWLLPTPLLSNLLVLLFHCGANQPRSPGVWGCLCSCLLWTGRSGRSKRLLISLLQSPSAVILEPQNIKSDTVSPSISHEVMGPDAMILVLWMLSFKPNFSTLLFHFHQEAF